MCIQMQGDQKVCCTRTSGRLREIWKSIGDMTNISSNEIYN